VPSIDTAPEIISRMFDNTRLPDSRRTKIHSRQNTTQEKLVEGYA